MFFSKKKDDNQVRRTQSVDRARTYYYRHNDGGSNNVAASADQRRPGRWSNVPMYIAGVVIVCCLLYSLLLHTKPKIVIVNDQDTAVQPFLRSKETYQALSETVLASSPMNRTKLTFNTETTAEALQAHIPEATDVSITLPIIGRNPVIYLRIAEPVFVMTTGTESFVVDERGRAVVPTHDMHDQDFLETLLVVNDESGLAVTMGQQAIPKEQVEFITSVQRLLAGKGVAVAKMVLPTVPNELHVYPKGEKYFVKYNLLLDAREQTGKYLATRQQLARDKAPANSYIDVRVEERVFVR